MRAEIGGAGFVPSFFLYTSQVVKKLASARGLLGYSFLARPLSKRFWTLSAWESKQSGVWKNCRLLLRAGGRDMFHRGHLHVVWGLRHVLVFLHRLFLGNCRTGEFHLMADMWG